MLVLCESKKNTELINIPFETKFLNLNSAEQGFQLVSEATVTSSAWNLPWNELVLHRTESRHRRLLGHV